MRLPSDRAAAAMLAGLALLLAVALGLIVSLADGLDERVVRSVHRWALEHSHLTGFLRMVSAIGQPVTWEALVAALALVLWRRGHGRSALQLAAGLAGAQIVSSVTKVLVERPRPALNHPLVTAFGYSFPSVHAFISAAAVLFVLRTLRTRITPTRWWAFATAGAIAVTLVGASRLVLGVHLLTDVLGGWALACAWGMVVAVIFPRPSARTAGLPGVHPAVPTRPPRAGAIGCAAREIDHDQAAAVRPDVEFDQPTL